MSSFDANAYFQRKAGNPITDKQNSIQQGLGDKYAALDARTKEIKAQYAQHQNSWAGKLGLGSESIAGEAVNLGASLVSGASRVAGQIAEVPLDVMTASIESQLSEEDIQAYNRYSQGNGSEDDIARLTSSKQGKVPKIQLIQQASESRAMSRNVSNTFDLTSIVSQNKRNQLTNDLGDGFASSWDQTKQGWDKLGQSGNRLSGLGDLASGVSKLAYNAGEAAVTNPSASSEYIVENAPQLALGLLGKAGKAALATSNVGYGSALYQEGVDNYQKANNGKLPPEELRREMQINAAGASLMEQASDMVMLGAAKLGKVKPDEAIRTGFKQSLKNTGKAVGTGFISEAPTEGVQTYLEGEATLKPASAKDIYVGAAIGGIAGSGLTGGMRSIAELAGATPEQVKEKAKGQQEVVDLKTAIDNNDTAAYLDPKSSSYSPAKAVAVHLGNSQKGDASPEAKEANLTQANKIVVDLETQLEDLKADTELRSPEGIAANQKRLEQYKAALAKADPANTGLVERLNAGIANTERALEGEALTPEAMRTKQAEISKLERELGTASQFKDMLHLNVQPKKEELASLVEQADSTPDKNDPVAVEASTKAANRILVLAMAAPESLDPETALRLADNVNNNLPEATRSFLRTFSAARQAENEMKNAEDVSKDIYQGTNVVGKIKYLGIADYNKKMGDAIAAGNEPVARKLLATLNTFAQNHQSKVDAGNKAIATIKGRQAQIVYNTDNNQWESTPEKYSDDKMRSLGGFTFSNPEKAIATFTKEAYALNVTASYLKAAYEMKFGKPESVAAVASTVVEPTTPVNSSQSPTDSANQSTTSKSSQLQSKVDTTVDKVAESTKTTEVVSTTTEQDAPEPLVIKKQSINPRRIVDPYKDSLFVAIAKWGGMKTQALLDMNIDLKDVGQLHAARVIQKGKNEGKLTKPALRSKMLGFNLPLHKKQGELTFDGLRERMLDAGYLLPEEDLLNSAFDKFIEELQGHPVFTGSGNEAQAAKAQELRDAEMLAAEEANESSGYNALTEDEQETADDIAEAVIVAAFGEEAAAWARGLKEGDPSITEEQIYAELQQYFGNQESTTQSTQGAPESSPNGGNQEGIVNAGKAETTAEEITEDEDGEPTSETESVNTSDIAPGTLEVFQKTYNRVGKNIQEVFQKMNLVAEFLVQKLGKETDKTQRPLVAVQDFLTEWNKEGFSLEAFLGNTQLSSKQEALLNDFKAKANEWLPLIKANLVKGSWVEKDNVVKDNPDYYYTDPIQFLIENTKQGVDMEENIKTAIAHAAYGWIIENAGNPALHTLDSVKDMFGVKEHEQISEELYHAIRDKGAMEKNVINSMGQKVSQALGLIANAEASQDFLARLESGFGAHVVKLLLDQNILERTQISAEIINAGLPDKLVSNTNSEAQHGFIRLARTEAEALKDRKLNAVAEGITQVAKGTGSVLTKLFGVESELKYPSWVPIKSRQKTTKNTDQSVPKLLQKFIKHEDSVPSRIRQDTWGLFNVMDKEQFLTIAGYEVLDPETMHTLNLDSTEATNDALIREYDRAEEYFTLVGDTSPAGLKQELYFEHTAWKQQRVGIATNAINPQTSKLQRWMLYRPEWETEVSSTDAAMMDNFRLRVAEGLGIKTDKQGNESSLNDFAGLFDASSTDPKVLTLRKAVEALQTAVTAEETLSPDAQQAIVDGVKVGGSKMHSLDALIALAHYENAKAKAKPDTPFSFTVQMMGEVDGVTNGPMLSHLLLGAANSADALFGLLNKGGFFREQDGFKNYNLWRGAPKHIDLYETTISHVLKEVRSLAATNESVNKVLPALWAITGSLDNESGKVEKAGRNIIKTPLTAMLFGSAIEGAIDSMFESFVETIYDGFEKVAKAPAQEQEAARVAYLAHLNTLLQFGGSKEKAPNVNVGELLQFEFSKNQKDALQNAFNATLGNAVAVTMEQDFAGFIDTRKQVNETAQATFAMYDAVYQGIRTSYINELMAKGELHHGTGKDGRLIPRQDLTKAQEKVLSERVKAINPVVHTYFSQESKGDVNSGLHISKSSRKLSTDPIYRSQVKFNKPFKNGAKSITTAAYQRALTAPGVAMLPMMIHSLDSAISHMAAFGTQVLNVHDAHGSGLKHFTRTAQRLNEATWKASLNYSPATEIRDSWVNIVTGMADLLQTEQDTEAVIANLKTVLTDLGKKYGQNKKPMPLAQVLQHVTDNMYYTAYAADRVKFETLKALVAIDQYALEGGQYDVTEAERKEAAKRLEALVGVAPAEVLAAIAKINAAVLGKATKASTTKESKAPATLLETLKTNQTTPAKTVLRELYRQLKEQKTSSSRNFQITLLEQLGKLAPDGLMIHMGAPEGAKTSDHAWYVRNGDIYLNPDIAESTLTEALLHELLHAVTSSLIDGEIEKETMDPTYSSPAKSVIDDLYRLKLEAQKFIKANKLTKYDGIFEFSEGLHELVAWGMTNQGFQRDVLSKIQGFKSQTLKNKLVTGWKAFIGSVVGILFKNVSERRQEIAENGLGVLIMNVSGLLAQAEQNKETNTKPKGSTGKVLAMASPSSDPYTTQEIYTALDNQTLQPSFNEHLQGLLNGIVTKLHGPYGSFKDALQGESFTDPLDAWAKAKRGNAAPFASKLMTVGIPISEQEVFVLEQVEATVRAAMTNSEGQTTAAYKELSKLFLEARSKLTVTDFEQIIADPVEAQKLHTFIFNNNEKSEGNKSDYLARFAALGLAHQGFNQLLKVATNKDARKLADADSFSNKLQLLFEKILSYFYEKVTHTYGGQRADLKLNELVTQLVHIEDKKAKAIKQRQEETNYLAPIEGAVKDLTEGLRIKVGDIGNSEFIQTSRSAVVRAAGKAVHIIANDRVDQFMETINQFKDKQFKGRQGMVAGLLRELIHDKEMFQVLHRATKLNETVRKDIITNRAKMVLKGFKDGKKLSKEAKAGVSAVFLRSGAHNLEQYSMVELEALLSSPTALDKAIKTEEGKLTSGLKDQHIAQANILGYYKATGQARGVLMLNAHLIARMSGTPLAAQITEQEAQQAEQTITALASLYAIKYTPASMIKEAREVLKTENTRTDGNGIAFTLALHRRLGKESLATVFKGNPALMEHGYTPEIFNAQTDLKFADKVEGQELIDQGYVQAEALPSDIHDPDRTEKHFYLLRDGGLSRYVSGALSITNLGTKGTLKHSGYMNPRTATGQQNLAVQAHITTRKMQELQNNTRNPSRDLSKESGVHLAPVYNEQGAIVNWRYLMRESTKDTLLERDNRFERILGALAGSIYDKQSSVEQNKTVLKAVKELYDAESKSQPEAYVLIGPKSDDPELQEIWNMLPESAKEEATSLWSNKGLYARSDSLDILFGYRKYSLANIFKQVEKERTRLEKQGTPESKKLALKTLNPAQQAFVMGVESVLTNYARFKLGKTQQEAETYAKRAAVYVTRGERAWQEVYKEVKDIIVVKSGLVLVGNIYSNFSTLALKGVSWKDMLVSTAVALKGATAYHYDNEELQKYKELLATGYTQGKEADIRFHINRLEDAIARNPVKELIDGGLMPTIVEDIDSEDDLYSYKNNLTKWVEGKTEWVNPKVKDAARVVYMAKDTKMYQGLSRITQLSDFVGRYALYQHLVSRKDKPLEKKAAIQEASEYFVNYDSPMQKGLQYVDDMGLTPFIKYFMRIQKPLLKLTRDNPARVLATVALGNFMDLGPILLDGSAMAHFGNNPTSTGPLRYFDTLGDLATVNGAVQLIK